MHRSVPVADVGGVVLEVATPTEEVPVVLEVPPAAIDEPDVVIQPDAVTDAGEPIQAVQHLRALRSRRAVNAPQHAGRKFMNRGREPLTAAAIASTIFELLVGRHGKLSLTCPDMSLVCRRFGPSGQPLLNATVAA
jgi:hypothetical protein